MEIKDKKRLMKLVSYLTMGDGSVYYNRGAGNALFSMTQTEDHLDFVEYVAGVLGNVTGCSVVKEERAAPRKNVYKVYSRHHPYFNAVRDRVYTDSYKGIDPHALKLMDWEALALLYMSDGCLGRYVKDGKVKSYSLTINMCRLSYGDQLLLKQCIRDTMGVEFNVVRTGRKYYTLRLRSRDIPTFIEGVRPYILESFNYKIDYRTVGSAVEADGDIV